MRGKANGVLLHFCGCQVFSSVRLPTEKSAWRPQKYCCFEVVFFLMNFLHPRAAKFRPLKMFVQLSFLDSVNLSFFWFTREQKKGICLLSVFVHLTWSSTSHHNHPHYYVQTFDHAQTSIRLYLQTKTKQLLNITYCISKVCTGHHFAVQAY